MLLYDTINMDTKYMIVFSCNATRAIQLEFFNEVNDIINIYELHNDLIITNKSTDIITYKIKLNGINTMKLDSFYETCRKYKWDVDRYYHVLEVNYPYIKENITIDQVNHDAGIVKFYRNNPLANNPNHKEYISVYMVNIHAGTPRNMIKITEWDKLVSRSINSTIMDPLVSVMDRTMYLEL